MTGHARESVLVHCGNGGLRVSSTPEMPTYPSLGHVLASSDEVREVHNSFSRSSPFSMDPSAFPEREKEDAYHFITYVPVNGTLYELDGLRRAPVRHGQCGARWTDMARETIEARIATYPPGSVSDSTTEPY